MNKIRIGPIEYEISKTPELQDDGRELSGAIIYHLASIQLLDGLSDQMTHVVLLHELLHGIMHQAGIENHSEGLIEALAYGLLDLARNNPTFLSFDFRGYSE